MEPVSDAPPTSEPRLSAFRSEINTIKQSMSQMVADMGKVRQNMHIIQQTDQLHAQHSGHRADSRQHHPAPVTGSGLMEPVSQQQACQQPPAAAHRGTSEKQIMHTLQQTNQHAPRDQPCAQDSGHLADSHWHHPAPATITQRIDQMVQSQDARFAAAAQRINEDFRVLDARREDLVAKINKDIRIRDECFKGILRRLDQLEQEQGERQAATEERINDLERKLGEAVMRGGNLREKLEERQAGAEERINNLEGEMVDFWNNLQTLNQTHHDVIGNSNKDIHKGVHMEGKGEIHTPSLGRVTQGVGESDPAPPQGS